MALGSAAVAANARPEEAALPERRARPEEGSHSATALLMVFASVVALGLAARSAGDIVKSLKRPAQVMEPDSAAEPRAGSPAAKPRNAAEAEDAAFLSRVRGAATQTRDYLRRIRSIEIDRPEALRALSRDLQKETDDGGLIVLLREMRRDRRTPNAHELRQIGALLLRGAAAQDDREEWASTRRLVEQYRLVGVCDRMIADQEDNR